MLKAKNYFAEFEKSFIGLVRKGHIYSGTEYDIELLKIFKKSLKGTVHFSVPKDGKIFDDGFKGIINKEIRLPYPAISLEYDTGDVKIVNKGIILAFEYTKEDFLNTLDESSRVQAFDVIKDFNGEMIIHVVTAGVSPGGWIILPISWVMPTQWDKEHDIDNVKLKLSENVTSYGGFVKFIPNMFEDLIKRYSHEWVKQVYELNIIDQVKVLLEFIEALSCSNVKMENIQNEDKKLNKKRIAEKKLPFYETKVLTLEVPGETKVSSESLGGTGITQRQHLRRGHIRRLANGNNIWINSYIAGSAAKGVITKSYNLVKS